jgi:hypothetical protein
MTANIAITPALVAAVRRDQCGSCGCQSYEHCPRSASHPCLREHEGGTRAPRAKRSATQKRREAIKRLFSPFI